MMTEILIAVIGVFTTIVSGWASWFFTRRKYNSEVDNNVIANMQQSLEFYMKLSDDNKARLDEALRRNDALENEVQQLRQQIFELMNNICYDMSCELRKKTKKQSKTKKNDNQTCSKEDIQGA